MALHAPHLFPLEECAQYEVWRRERWSAPDAPETEWMTVGKTQRALEEIRGKEELDASLVAEIAAYLQSFGIMASWCSPQNAIFKIDIAEQ